MPAGTNARRLEKVTRQWLDLAERRLASYEDLYRTGRWRHYYPTEALFAVRMLDVIKVVKTLRRVCDNTPRTSSRVELPARGVRLAGLASFALRVLALAALVLSPAPLRAQTADSIDRAADLRLGGELLAKNCAACHAVGPTGASPNKDAPAFRTLGQRYPVDQLEEALGEGILSGHPDMPEFRFDADEVGAIIAYLQSIQQR